MPKFKVKRHIDALIIEEVEIDAADAKSAALIARSNEKNLLWRKFEVVSYDARRFVSHDQQGDVIPDSAVGDF